MRDATSALPWAFMFGKRADRLIGR
jgi:hypothetical protein